jgi:hypothetical protein
MKAFAIVVCLAGSGALWAWAVLAPKQVEALDEKYSGTFELFRYEAAPGQMGDDPVARNHRWIFEFRPGHLYLYRILFQGGSEMSRRAGVVTIEVMPEGNEFVVMTQHTSNDVAEPGEPQRYLAEWGSDDKGPYLHLTAQSPALRGEQWFLRRVQE